MNKKIIAIIIYSIGVFCVLLLVIGAIIGRNIVIDPNAIFPETIYERCIIFLGIGFVPMLISCLFLISSYGITNRKKKVLVLLPGIITGIPFVIGICLITYLLILALMEVVGIVV